jgi:Ca2+/Na+ antiporter
MGLTTALVGLFYNSAIPLIYEAIAEIMYPLPESLSTSILVQWINLTGLILLFIAPNRSELMNLIVLITVIVCVVMIVIARFSYRRRDEDERKRLETEQEQILNYNDINSQIYGINNEAQYGTFS